MSSGVDYASVMQGLLAAGVAPDLAASTIAGMMTGQAVGVPAKSTKPKTSKPKSKEPRKPVERKPVEPECQCAARVWGGGEGHQCAVRKVAESDFCAFHTGQAKEGEKPLQFTAEGAKTGLHLGRFADAKPWRSESGEVCYAEFAPEGAVDALKSAGEFKWHQFVKQGRQENGTVAPKKARAPKAAKPVKEKKPRGQNAFMFYLAEKRAEVKALLLEEAADGKVPVTAVTKKIGAMWQEIKDKPDAAKYHQLATESKEAAAEKVAVVVPVAPLALAADAEAAMLASAAVEASQEIQSAEDILAELGVSTPSSDMVAEGEAAARVDGRWESGGEEETEEGEETEEFEHDGQTYFKTSDGRLFQMEEEEPVLKGQVGEDGEVEIY